MTMAMMMTMTMAMMMAMMMAMNDDVDIPKETLKLVAKGPQSSKDSHDDEG